jgi:hypothetical protein
MATLHQNNICCMYGSWVHCNRTPGTMDTVHAFTVPEYTALKALHMANFTLIQGPVGTVHGDTVPQYKVLELQYMSHCTKAQCPTGAVHSYTVPEREIL